MLHLLARLSGLFERRGRHKRKSRAGRDRARVLFPALEVRMLEERRVFHAGAIAAPVAGTDQPLPPPPTTIVTLDASQNLLVQDAWAGGQNDQLTIRLDAAHGRFEIFDPNNLLQTDIAGATGSGTSRVYIPVESIAGSKVIVNTLGGEDSVTVDLGEGLAGKALFYDGGVGEQDSLTLVGGSYEAVGYLFQGDGTTQIQVGAGPGTALLQITGVEPIHDTLAVQARQFSLGGGLSGTLSDDGAASNDQLQLTMTLGTIVTFVSPSDALTIQAVDGSGGTVLSLKGLDAHFAADLHLDAGASGHVEVSGEVNLHGGDLMIRGETIYVAGRITTHSATIELDAESSLTITAEGVFENHTGQVLLDAGSSGTLRFSGRIDVSGHSASESGGTVHLLGRQVEILGQASIDASGFSGGGEVLVGGDYQGINPLVRRATNTFMSAEASIHANALVNGNGGKIIVWADEAAIVAGSGNLEARGGPQGGNGGLIETSGKRYLYVDAAPDAAGPAGAGGRWLLDPLDVTINNGVILRLDANGEFIPTETPSVTTIGAAEIASALKTMDVDIYTGDGGGDDGDITVAADIKVVNPTGTFTLTLHAANNIVINNGAEISVSGGNLNVVLHATAGEIPGKLDNPDGLVGDVTIHGDIDTGDGDFRSEGMNFRITGSIATGDGALEINHAGNVDFDGGTVSGGDVSMTGSTITSSGLSSIDITTSGGEISLTSAGTIGSILKPLQINTGTTGLVRATTSGSIFLTSSGGLRIGQLLTSGTHIIIVNTTDGADLTIAESSNTDDQWLLFSDNNLSLEDGVGITADKFFFIGAEGSITGGSDPDLAPTIDFRQTDTTVGLTIDAGSIGTADIPIIVDLDPNSATAQLDLKTEGNIYVLFAEGDPTPSRFVNGTITAPHSGVTIGLGTLNGNVTLSDLPSITDPVSSSISPLHDLTDNGLHLEAHGAGTIAGNVNVNIISEPSVYDPLEFTSVTLIADGIIYGFANPVSGVAINTAANPTGSITLQSGGPILNFDEFGSPGPLRISAGTGIVSAKTTGTSGDIFLSSLGDLNLGVIETEATMPQFVSLRTDAAMQVTGASDTEDTWEVSAAKDIDFQGGSIRAVSVLLDSNGGVILSSGNAAIDIDTSPSGVITLDAASIGTSSDPLIVSVGATGFLNLQRPGDMYIDVAQGSFRSSQLVTLPTGNIFDLEVLSGSLIFDTVCDLSFVIDLRLAASANIESQGVGRVIGELITLTAGGSVGASLTAPLVVTANNALNAVTAATGNIYVASPQNLAVSQARALVTGKEISFKTTGTSTFLDVSVTSLDDDNWRLVSEGDLTLRVADNATGIQFSQLLEVSTAGARNVRIEATNGPIDVDDIRPGFNLNDDFVTLVSGGGEDISFHATGKALQAALLVFVADGSIGSFANPFVVNVSGTVTATATTGDVFIKSVGPLNVIAVAAGGSNKDVSFVTTGVGSPLNVTTVGLDDDDWHLVATGDLTFTVHSDIRFSQIKDLQTTAPGRTILLDARGGSIDVDALSKPSDPGVLYAGVVTANANLTLIAMGSIQTGPSVVLPAASLIVVAVTGDIGSAGASFAFSSPSLITLSGGSQWLDAQIDTLLGFAVTFDPATGLFKSGDITLTGGRFFLVNAVFAPPSQVVIAKQLIVGDGVLLGGTGEVNANVLVQSASRTSPGGIIDMGFAPGTTAGTSTTAGDTGRLVVNGNLTFQRGATLVADINPPYSLPGADYDQIVVKGALTINDATLTLRGADQLRVTLNPIKLIDVVSTSIRPAGTGFLPDGKSLVQDGAFIRANLGFFRGKLLFDGGDGNDVVLSELSLAPPIQNPNLGAPKLRVPIFTTTERPIPLVQTPPPSIPPTIQPFVEPEVKEASQRMIQVRIVIPVDDAGNVREEKVMELTADWLEHLPMILRRLPDDHYRIYLVLDGGSEERLVIDVFVKGGRPVEPSDIQAEAFDQPMTPSEVHEEGAQAEAAMLPGNRIPPPALPNSPASSLPAASRAEFSGETFGGYDHHRHLLVGAATAMTAVAASRRTQRWSDQVDQAAAAIGSGPPQSSSWGWWRWGSRSASSHR